MKVFISWSGTRSKYVADLLRNWLPKVLQAVKPWISDEDISMGTRWAAEIAGELEQTKVGIVCLTPENQHNPWVMFEAGALSKTILHAYVCPYLIDLTPSQLSGPLAQFQAATATKDGTAKVVQTLNKALDNLQLPSLELEDIFEVWWPRLEQQLKAIPAGTDQQPVKRTAAEILDELVNNSREQLRREEIRIRSHQYFEARFDQLLAKFEGAMSVMNTGPESALSKIQDLLMEPNWSLEHQGVTQLEFQEAIKSTEESSQTLSDLMKTMKEMQLQSKEDTEMLLKMDKDGEGSDGTPSGSVD